MDSNNLKAGRLLKNFDSWMVKRLYSEARSHRDRVRERGREIRTNTNTYHEHEFEPSCQEESR
jgi:nitrate reductase assembly molybdenum cofactor insertion protein NarJ